MQTKWIIKKLKFKFSFNLFKRLTYNITCFTEFKNYIERCIMENQNFGILSFKRNINLGIFVCSFLVTLIIILYAILVSGGFGLSLNDFLKGQDPNNVSSNGEFNSQGPLIFIWSCILLVLFILAYWFSISLLIVINVYLIKKYKKLKDDNWLIKVINEKKKIILNSTLFILFPIALFLSLIHLIISFKKIKALKLKTKELIINK